MRTTATVWALGMTLLLLGCPEKTAAPVGPAKPATGLCNSTADCPEGSFCDPNSCASCCDGPGPCIATCCNVCAPAPPELATHARSVDVTIQIDASHTGKLVMEVSPAGTIQGRFIVSGKTLSLKGAAQPNGRFKAYGDKRVVDEAGRFKSMEASVEISGDIASDGVQGTVAGSLSRAFVGEEVRIWNVPWSTRPPEPDMGGAPDAAD